MFCGIDVSKNKSQVCILKEDNSISKEFEIEHTKQGFEELEKHLGISIDISPKVATLGKEVTFSDEEKGAYITFTVQAMPEQIANFYVEDEYLFSATIGKNGQIRVAKDSDVGRKVLRALIKSRLKGFI